MDDLNLTLTIAGEDKASEMVGKLNRELENTRKLVNSISSGFSKPFAFKVANLDKIEASMGKVADDIRAATTAMQAFNREAARTPKGPRSPFPPRSPGAPRIPRTPRTPSPSRPSASTFSQAGHAFHKGYRQLAHPYFSSPAFVAMGALTTAILSLRESIEAAAKIDTATTKLEMFGGMSPAEATAARSKALKDSLDLGVGAETIIGSQAQAMRAGLSKELGTVLGDLIPKAAAAMGEPAEKLAESLGEAVTQGISMGLIKGPDGVRRFMNVTAGMSNFGGMTPQKMDQFWASGGMGAGKAMGWDSTDTAGMASVFGSMGSRTGQFDARFIGDIANVVPFLKDRYMRAARGPYSEENSALVTAPRRLGYGNVDNMSDALMGGPEGVVDFFSRIAKLHNEKLQRQILKSVGFGQQGLAVVAEVGENPEKALAALKQARDLSKQAADADYLTTSFAKWRTSLVFMIQQIEAGFEAIKAELGDVVKDDLIAPFRDIWVETVKGLLDGGLRQRFHNDLVAFVNGLGFQDVAAMLSTIKNSVGSFDAAGFLKGLGEGIRAMVDNLKGVFNALSWLTGQGNAELIGKLTAEFFGLALATHAMMPVIQILAAISTFVTGIKLAVAGFQSTTFASLVASLTSFAALDLVKLAGGLGLVAAAIEKLGEHGLLSKGLTLLPKTFDQKGVNDWLWGAPEDQPGFQKQSFSGSGLDPSMLHRTAFISETTPVGRAILSTDETVKSLLDNARKASNAITLASYGGSGSMGGVGGSIGASGGAPGSYVRTPSLPGSNGKLPGVSVPDVPLITDGKTITGLGEAGTKAFASILGKRESGNRYGIVNSYGYAGRWQMGAAALAENGYVRPGTTNRGMRNPAAWTGKGGIHSLDEFLANKNGVQDREFIEYTQRHYQQLFRAGVIKDGMVPKQMAGWLAAAHLKGVGGAIKLARGHDNADANGTTASSYFRMMGGVTGDNGVAAIAGHDPKSVAASVAPSIRKGHGRHAPQVTNHITIHDATDPNRVGEAVRKHMDKTIDYRTHDVEFDV